MAKRDLLKLPDDFEANVRALLETKPAPHDTAGSRKAAPPAPKGKTKARKGYRRTKAEAAAQGQGVRYEYEAASVLKAGAREPAPAKR